MDFTQKDLVDAVRESATSNEANQSIKVEIVSDAICPWCYVAKRNFERAVTQLPEGVTASVQWLPYELNPDMPVEGKDRREYRSAKFGSWERSQELDVQVATAAAQAGLTMHHDLMKRTPNTMKAHRLIWLAEQEGVQDTVVESLFSAYFVEGRDVGDLDTLIDIASAAGIERNRVEAYFASEEGMAEIAEHLLSARLGEVASVPTFIINGQVVFSGGLRPELMLEHLLAAAATPS